MSGSDWLATAIVIATACLMNARLLRRLSLFALGAGVGCALIVAAVLVTRQPWCPPALADWCHHGTVAQAVGRWIDGASGGIPMYPSPDQPCSLRGDEPSFPR